MTTLLPPLFVAAIVSPQHAGAEPPLATSERGLVGSVRLNAGPKGLRAKADQPISAPILVRLTQLEGGKPDTPNYLIEFIGAVAGEYDLRDYLELSDSSPAHLPTSGVEPLRVRVESQLPANHGSDLFTLLEPSFRFESYYRTIAIAVGVAWLAIPAVVLVRRWMRRPAPIAAPPVDPPPTLADLLRPLVERAMGEGLSIRDQGRLELLLLHFWRQQLQLEAHSPSDAIAVLRSHPEAGTLLRAIERWLHARGAGDARPEEDIARLLAPYASVTASPEVMRQFAESPPPASGTVGATGRSPERVRVRHPAEPSS